MLLILLFIAGSVDAQKISRQEIRRAFQLCTNKDQSDKLYNQINLLEQFEPIELGYKGAIFASQARFSSNPFKKYSYCKTGLTNISDAIKIAPHDLELRYLRMVIETNIPDFLRMSGNIIEDKMVIFSLIEKESDIVLKRLVGNFLMNSGLCSKTELLLLATV